MFLKGSLKGTLFLKGYLSLKGSHKGTLGISEYPNTHYPYTLYKP